MAWFKVETSILDDPKLGQLSGDECWGYFRLLALLKREESTDGTIRLDDRGLRYVTRRHQIRHARTMVASWASKGLLRASLDGPYTLLACSKWPEIQGRGVQTRLDKTRLERGEKKPAATPPPAPDSPKGKPDKIARKKSGTQCPENLTREQWGRVRKWRDANYPQATGAQLLKIWKRHANFHRHTRKAGHDWVLSFYNWASKDLDELPTASTSTARPTPPVYEREEPPEPLTAEQIAENTRIGDERRAKGRARHAEASTDPPDAEAKEGW